MMSVGGILRAYKACVVFIGVSFVHAIGVEFLAQNHPQPCKKNVSPPLPKPHPEPPAPIIAGECTATIRH